MTVAQAVEIVMTTASLILLLVFLFGLFSQHQMNYLEDSWLLLK